MRGRIGSVGTGAIFALVSVLVLLDRAGAVRAQATDAAPIVIRLESPPPMIVGARAEVIAHVRLEAGAGQPMLLTPSSDGTAVEVVRGRLTRADADGDDPRELRFRVPLVARMAGTAVVRVRVDGFACREGRCRALQIEESVAIEVLPAPSASR